MRVKIRCTTADGNFVGMSLFPLSPAEEEVIKELPDELVYKLLEEKYIESFAMQCHKLSMDDDIHVQIDLIKKNYVSKA